ncbi:hypothetical protein [Paraburkholderia sp. GAS32]|uniref:hypothetical protein n=1 Tax=Paraburkholderia sp. GAS32 TaxID=3035129 RepID=UPI003D261083
MTALHQRVRAPITPAVRAQLKRDCSDLNATAARKQTTLDKWDHAIESAAVRDHFELGCWLHYLTKQPEGQDSIALRVECVRRLFEAGFDNPSFAFFTAFDFGERQFDNIFEQGDSKAVIEGLRAHLGSRMVRAGFEYFGWPLVDDRQAALF